VAPDSFSFGRAEVERSPSLKATRRAPARLALAGETGKYPLRVSFTLGPRRRFRDRPQRPIAGILLSLVIGAFATTCTHVPADRKDATDIGRTAEPAPVWNFDTGG
jgi:hypothetical protein